MGGGVDLGQAAASGAHLECLKDQRGGLRVYDPAVSDMGLAIAMNADLNRLALEATRGCAGDSTIGFNKVAQTAGDIFAEIVKETLVHPVDGSFEKAAFGAFGDVVGEADDFVAAAAQIGLVKLGIVNVPGKTGHFPHDNSLFLGMSMLAEVLHKRLELVAADSGTARTSSIGEPCGDSAGVLDGPAFDGLALLVSGEFLMVATRVTQVGGQGMVDRGAVFFNHEAVRRFFRSQVVEI